MAEFHETGYGRTFFTHQLPELIGRLGDVAKAMTEIAGAVNRLSPAPACAGCGQPKSTAYPDAHDGHEDGRPFVEQVWILHELDTRRPVDKLTVYASEASVRAAIRDHWLGSSSVGLADHWLEKLEAWDGQSTIVIGGYRVSTATVNL